MQRLVSQSAFLAFALCLMVSSIFGQSFFTNNTSTPTNSTAPASGGTNQTMSPDEFKNKVKALEQETKNRTAQEASQLAPRKAGPSPAVSAPMQTTTVTTTSEPVPAPQPEPVPEVMPEVAPSPAPAPPPTRAATPQPLPPAIPPPPPTTTRPTEVYTGFGTPGSGTSTQTSPGSSNKNPSWNIKY